jgi:hypothetical protein
VACEQAMTWCMAEQGYCARDAVAYVFGSNTRKTIVTGTRALELATAYPEGARCGDHAVEEFEAVVQALRVPVARIGGQG